MSHDPFEPDDLDFTGPIAKVVPDNVRARHHAELRRVMRRGSKRRHLIGGLSFGIAAAVALTAALTIWRPTPLQEPTAAAAFVLRCTDGDSIREIVVVDSPSPISAVRSCREALDSHDGALSLQAARATLCPSAGVLIVDLLGRPCSH